MTPDQRLARAVRTADRMQTINRYLRTVTQMVTEVNTEVLLELEEARAAVHEAEAKTQETVTTS